MPDKTPYYEKPCAAQGLISYRYRLPHGSFVMIGAENGRSALKEAIRAYPSAEPKGLEVWDGKKYVPVRLKTAYMLEGYNPDTKQWSDSYVNQGAREDNIFDNREEAEESRTFLVEAFECPSNHVRIVEIQVLAEPTNSRYRVHNH